MSMFDGVSDLLGLGSSPGEQANAAQQASGAQAAAIQKQMYDQSRADLQPWREAGTTALSGMQDPAFQKSFTMADFQKDPGYDFRMQEGQKALDRSAAAKGNVLGGAQLKAISDYGQNFASNEYNNAYNRYNNDMNTRYSRLGQLSGMGEGAASQQAGFAQNYGNSMSNLYQGMGNAQASSIMGDANRSAQQLNTGIQMGAMAFCDERLKTDIEEVSKEDLAELKSCIKAYKFRYKDQKHGIGEFIGPMAQDLEKSKLGRTLVVQDSEGNKIVDLGRAMMLVLASLSEGA